jgi:hypothetical protein
MIENAGHDKVVVVAQTKFSVGFENPVLTEIRRRWPGIEVISESPENDFHTLRHARHIALSVGTFAVAAAMLNTRLESLHVPRYDRVENENFGNANIFPPDGGDLGFTQYDYEIRRYEAMRAWANSPEQRDLMLRHSREDIEISTVRDQADGPRGRWSPAVVSTKRPSPES